MWRLCSSLLFLSVAIEGCFRYPKGKSNPCDDLRCGPGEECIVSQAHGILSAKCVCPTHCPNYGDSLESSAVCSSNGVDYPSSCHLRHHACETSTNITVKYYGRCDPCQGFSCPYGLSCHVGLDRKPTCRCSEQCALVHEPVCATDGKTYTNECVMRTAACKEQREVEVWKIGKCEDHRNACQKLKCGYESECRIISETKAMCQCTEKCPMVVRPVCATNGLTYENECEMKRASCLEKISIQLKHQGTCGMGACATFDGCKSPQVCEVSDGKPRCVCPKCTDELMEVCASDGRTYANECKMRRAACISKKPLFVKYTSICQGCEKMKCDFYSNCVVVGTSSPQCKCPDNCPYGGNNTKHEVCGTDGVTYSSECHLQRSACQQKKFIVVAFQGKCDACSHIQCRYGEECRAGICMCSYNCANSTTSEARICAENGVIYPSECHLQLASCQKGAPIAEMSMAHCHSSTVAFADKCECNRLGSFGHECDDRGQCRCRPGVGGLKCDHCLPAFWGIHLIANGALSCRPCGCSAFGSARSDCEQTTGICECRPGTFGDKCNLCPQGTIMTPSGCAKASEYHTPRDCLALKCHHGAKCVMSPGSGLPDCACPNACNLAHLGLAGNMSVCASDGTTFDDSCELRNFACKHQIDLVPVSLGICEHDTFDILDRPERERTGLGSPCSSNKQCDSVNAVCVSRPGKNASCECAKGLEEDNGSCFRTAKDLGLKLIGDHYILRDKMSTKSTFEIHISTTSNKPGSILFGNGSKDFFAINLTPKRRVQFRFGEHRIVESKERVNNDIRIKIEWDRSEVQLNVNGEVQKEKVQKFEPDQLKALFIGGRRELSSDQIEGVVHSISTDGVVVKANEMKLLDNGPAHLKVVTFTNSSYLKYERVGADVRSKTDIEVHFRPTSPEGTIFVWFNENDAHSDFATLLLADRKLFFVVDFGSGPVLLRGGEIELNTWSTILITRRLKEVTMSKNGKHEVSVVGQGKNSHLDLGDRSKLYIGGGVPDSLAIPHRIRKYIKPFRGWIQRVAVNERPLQLLTGWMEQHHCILELDELISDCQRCSGRCTQKLGDVQCSNHDEPAFFNREHDHAYVNGANELLQEYNESRFSLDFKTVKEEATLWFEGVWSGLDSGDFFTLVIHHGQLKVGLNLGKDETLKLVSTNVTVSDNEWHTVAVSRKDRKTELQLDGKKLLTVVSTAGAVFLDTNGLVYPGGRTCAQAQKLKLPPKFVGCIKGLSIDGQRINLLTDSIGKNPTRCGL